MVHMEAVVTARGADGAIPLPVVVPQALAAALIRTPLAAVVVAPPPPVQAVVTHIPRMSVLRNTARMPIPAQLPMPHLPVAQAIL